MIIIGIDPGTVVTGYGIIATNGNAYHLIDYGCIRPPRKNSISDRYLIISESVDVLLEKHEPHVLVVETQFVHKNVQSAIKLGMARGIVILTAKKRGIPIFEYAPSKAKRAVVGRGHASKKQVQGMVQVLLNMETLPEPEDAADALALAITHAQAKRYSIMSGKEI